MLDGRDGSILESRSSFGSILFELLVMRVVDLRLWISNEQHIVDSFEINRVHAIIA
jgi:hypothetical protein